MKNKVKVFVSGLSFSVLTEEKPERVKQVAKIVNDKINAVSLQSQDCSKLKASALCAMEYCSECMRQEAIIEDLQAEIVKLRMLCGGEDNQ